ncbi:MAG: glucose-1-phosphate adenylyltransferase subunit GlgD [Lachnospiraceae bacterium]|nr:glucose-1-phosphate adenylyltransferase subunit GlgD [Lachnospiraceae bacterium]
MHLAFGIINSADRKLNVEGLQDYRPIGSFSFLGRYRLIDFPISNLVNSGIEKIAVQVGDRPRSLVQHLGSGRHYGINSKTGRLQILFSDEREDSNYNTDIASYLYNLSIIEKVPSPYVVICPSYIIYTQDFCDLLDEHIKSDADITLLYHTVDNANEKYLGCHYLSLNRQKGVESIEENRGRAKTRNIFMDTYIMKKELFIELIHKAKKVSSMYSLIDVVSDECHALDVRGISHKGYFAAVTDFQSYYSANLDLLEYHAASNLFHSEWPILTKTTDSSPTQYFEGADVKSCFISNGCDIEGKIENSILGRGVTVKAGSVIKNSIILSGTYISENTVIENQVIDKGVQIKTQKKIVSSSSQPGYIRKRDIL